MDIMTCLEVIEAAFRLGGAWGGAQFLCLGIECTTLTWMVLWATVSAIGALLVGFLMYRWCCYEESKRDTYINSRVSIIIAEDELISAYELIYVMGVQEWFFIALDIMDVVSDFVVWKFYAYQRCH